MQPTHSSFGLGLLSLTHEEAKLAKSWKIRMLQIICEFGLSWNQIIIGVIVTGIRIIRVGSKWNLYLKQQGRLQLIRWQLSSLTLIITSAKYLVEALNMPDIALVCLKYCL